MIIGPWLRRMAQHNDGIALTFARTETALFHETVWERANAVFFFAGRLFSTSCWRGRSTRIAAATSMSTRSPPAAFNAT